jgi:hypothetical protein
LIDPLSLYLGIFVDIDPAELAPRDREAQAALREEIEREVLAERLRRLCCITMNPEAVA